MPAEDSLYIGLMSGTSIDGIDAVLASIGDSGFELRATRTHKIPQDLQQRLHDLAVADTVVPEELGIIDREFGVCLAEAVLELTRIAQIAPSAVRAIGSHGQTIRHQPRRDAGKAFGFSWQIGDPNTIAELTGVTTIADFRRRDIAAGGQGAPLVPAFHRAVFASATRARVVVNIGGIANLTLLPGATGTVSGFDTGPGNTLLDGWNRRHRGSPYDDRGAWARSGRVDSSLLGALLAHPYFSLKAPKSTGREEFNLRWLDAMCGNDSDRPEENVQATLVELTAISIAAAITGAGLPSPEIFLCGGGARNDFLVERLRAALPHCPVATTQVLGVDPEWVEASAFAWLAAMHLRGEPGNLPAVTGASHPLVLGALYPGTRKS